MRLLALVLGLVTGAGVVTACSGESRPPTIDYVVDAGLTTYNANTVTGNSDGALMAVTRVLPGFSLLGNNGQVMPDRDVGTVTAISQAPLTLRYVFSPQAVFSDGTPMDCDDLLLAWAAMSGRFPGFTPATTAGYRDVRHVDCRAGAKTATVVFAAGRVYRDWLSLFGAGTLLPAHVVARKAGVADVVAAIRGGNPARIGKLAKAWNTGFTFPNGELEPADFPASGPFRISAADAAEGLVLVPNDKWWGDAPAATRIAIRGARHDLAALTSGDFDVADVADGIVDGEISNSATSKAPASAGPVATTSLSIDELVLSQRGVFSDVRVRQAFALCVPRPAIATQFGAGSPVWNLRTQVPGDSLAAQLNGQVGLRYARPDIIGARELLGQAAASGVQGVSSSAGTGVRAKVRIGYRTPHARDQALVAAITGSCRKAGIEVTDVGSDDLAPTALGKRADALLISSGSGFAATGAASPIRDSYRLRAGDPLNLAGADDPQVSQAVDTLSVVTSATGQLDAVRTIETGAWSSMMSIPLVVTPRVYRSGGRVAHVVPGHGRNGTGWNMDRWSLTE